MSVATGEIAARWDRAKGAVHGLPTEVRRVAPAMIHEDVAGAGCGSRSARSSNRAHRRPTCSSPPSARRPGARPAPASSSTPTPVSACSPSCATSPDSHVVAIETSKSAVADARENLAGRRHDIVRGEVGGWRPAADLGAEVVIADPARTGLGAPGVAALARLGAPVLVLVSCDPASLGRDAMLLDRAGYAHERSEVIDTFPETTHIEVVSRFSRG